MKISLLLHSWSNKRSTSNPDNPTPVDGNNLGASSNDPTHGSDTIVSQDYEEANTFTNSVAAIPVGQDGKWDFALVDNSATEATTYCLRVVKSDGTVLDTYTVIPEVTTSTGASSRRRGASGSHPHIY